jgi:hypothetical protein
MNCLLCFLLLMFCREVLPMSSIWDFLCLYILRYGYGSFVARSKDMELD